MGRAQAVLRPAEASGGGSSLLAAAPSAEFIARPAACTALGPTGMQGPSTSAPILSPPSLWALQLSPALSPEPNS